jgi:transposase, IS5 family
VELRQSYARVAKGATIKAGRPFAPCSNQWRAALIYAKQFKRMNCEIKLLRTRLGRAIRDSRRKTMGDEALGAAFAVPLIKASQFRGQKQRQRGWKLYSWHAPETECIAKGKGGQFIFYAKALPGNPYNGHTLRHVLQETEALTGREIERIYVDKGYVGHDAPKPKRLFCSGQNRGVQGQINAVMAPSATTSASSSSGWEHCCAKSS